MKHPSPNVEIDEFHSYMESKHTLESKVNTISGGSRVALSTSSGPFLGNFLGGVLSLRVPTIMGVADDIWAWPIKFGVLYAMKLWRYGKA